MRRRGLLGLLALSIGGCAGLGGSITQPPAAVPWQARQQALLALKHWELQGRISVTRGEDGWHGSLRWQQRADDYAIDLVGPLGQGRIDIDGTSSMVRLRTGNGQELRADDVEALLLEATGLVLPISGLFYWIRGLPDVDRPATLTGDEQGLLSSLEQQGWQIVFSDYQVIETLHLPTRISAQQQALRLKLAINSWTLPT